MRYGIEYAYGPRMINKGNRPNLLLGFRWAKELDEWLSRGPSMYGPGYRQAITSRHPYVRLSQRHPEGWETNDDGLRFYRVTD